MKILCINTAFSSAQIALNLDGKIFSKTLESNSKSSEKVMPAIDEILRKNNIQIGDLKYIGVVVGTGSFTGVRIGVALVKGFASVFKNLKIIAINSLDLMAFEFAQNNQIDDDFCCVQNALSGRFFLAEFDKNGELQNDYRLVRSLPAEKLKIGLSLENLSETDVNIDFLPENLINFTKKQIKNENFVSESELAPVYLRLSQAEENLEKGLLKNVKN